MRRVFVLLALLPAFTGAQVDERERLGVDRRALDQRFATEEQACQSRFAVTPCVDDVRLRRRLALAPLRERELQLDDEQRRQRASVREAARKVRLAEPARPATEARPSQSATAVTSREAADPRPHAEAGKTSAAQAAERSRAMARRAQEVQQTQGEIARKLLERQAAGKKHDSLPAPTAASLAASAAR
jgi:colicin import membrane protein